MEEQVFMRISVGCFWGKVQSAPVHAGEHNTVSVRGMSTEGPMVMHTFALSAFLNRLRSQIKKPGQVANLYLPPRSQETST